MKGYPVPIVIPEKGNKFILKEEALQKILLQDHIKNRNAVVISIAGAFRKGKSFLLDFFLRYMNNQKITTSNDWLGDEDSSLKGFSWKGGSARDTSGILMWSEVFCVTSPKGEELAVIFLDTQGAFDSESTIRECATVFALSTMLSSIQIYNLSHNIQEDHLHYLQLFAEYGRMASENTGKTPFQKLLFLVRDWSWPYEKPYGFVGGKLLLEEKMKITEGQDREKQSLRKHIKSNFSTLQCYLLPHPGEKVTLCKDFDGRLSDIKTEFKNCLKELIPILLSSENLIQKEINGQTIKVTELVTYFKCYMDVFSCNKLPKPKTIFDATVEANNLSAVAKALETYRQLMDTFCRTQYIDPDMLAQKHLECKKTAVAQFTNQRKMGGTEFSENYKKKLEKKITEHYNWLKECNKYRRKVLPRVFKSFLAGAAAGGVAGIPIGVRIGGIAGVLEGPIGIAIGSFAGVVLGGAIGGIVGGVKAIFNL